MTGPDLPAKFGNDAVLSAATPGGLPYPVSSDPANQGANAIKALALAVDGAFAGPWTPVPPRAGFTGPCVCRIDGGGSVQIAGQLAGTFTGGPTLCDLPVGFRPVFPVTSPLMTYYVFSLAANASGNAGTLSVRVWGNGAITVVGVNGSFTSVDLASIRFSNRNG
jgi:hypothetical protein